MEQHPECVVCGSYADVITEDGEFVYLFSNLPSTPEDIVKQINNKNCFIHSAAFYKKSIAIEVGGYYEPIIGGFEDRVFFFQMIKKGLGCNIRKPLIKYRIGPFSITKKTYSRRYKKLVREVSLRGFITEKEKKFWFEYRMKGRMNKNVQLSNYYLMLSRLYSKYQNDTKKVIFYFKKGMIISPLNPIIVISLLHILINSIIRFLNEKILFKS